MSTLTKVFVVLVSVLSIFLCGAVVTFVLNTEHWKAAYQEQQTVAQAAQVQAVAAEEAMARSIQRYETLNKRLQDQIASLERDKSELQKLWTVESQARLESEGKAAASIHTMQSLQEVIKNMYETQNSIQAELDRAHSEMLSAKAKAIDMTRALNSTQVERDQLVASLRRNEEKVSELESELSRLRQQLQEVKLVPGEMESGGDRVTKLTPQQAMGVPIRGRVTELDPDNDLASISIGSSSGVKQDMRFLVLRNGEYLGDLAVTYVEPAAAGGRVVNERSPIRVGDIVTTGFE